MLKKLQKFKRESGTDWFVRLKSKRFFYSTGISRLDDILEGGLKTTEILSINGEESTGKTQFIWTILCDFLLNYEQGYVYYADFHRGLLPNRLEQILHSRNPNLEANSIKKLLNRILYIEMGDEYDFWDFMNNYTKLSEGRSIRLFIVENVGSILNQTTIKYHQGQERGMQKQIMSGLYFFAKLHNIPIILTNHLSYNARKPALGTFWNNKIPKQIYLSKNNGKSAMHYIKNGIGKAKLDFKIGAKGVVEQDS